MPMIYIWECPSCLSQTKLNYNADEENAKRISECICGDRIQWKENIDEQTNTNN